MNFFKLSKEIKNSRKICTEFYSRFFSQIFSHYFSSLFILLGISPNIITGLMGLLVIPLSLLFYFSNEFYAIIYSFLFVIINILDTSDGEVARYTKKTSTKGVFYDKFFQLFSDAVIISTIILSF